MHVFFIIKIEEKKMVAKKEKKYQIFFLLIRKLKSIPNQLLSFVLKIGNQTSVWNICSLIY